MARCPCGGDDYARCCGRFHDGRARADTALELMRSRYAAFATGAWDYLADTRHPSRRRQDEREAVASGGDLRWTALEIVDTAGGGAGDARGVVEFIARYESGAGGGAMRERSRFVREGGAWFYVDGVEPEPGRNDPCACGSGKKFKKCCGR